MTTKHTPGEWRVRHNGVGGPFISSDNGTIADVRTFGGIHVGGPQHPETMANARLIAAAPDLLEALQVMVRDYTASHADGGSLEMQPAILQASQAIARATGEQP